MKRLLSIALLLPSLIVLSSMVAGQEEKDERPSKKAEPADYKKLATIRPASFHGKVSVTAKTVAFRIDDADYRKQLKKAASLPNPVQQKAAMAAVERQFASLKWALGKDFELELSDKVVMRKTKYEFEYDEKGNPKPVPPAIGGTYPAKVEDFGDWPTTVTFGAMKNGKPTAVRLVVDNSK